MMHSIASKLFLIANLAAFFIKRLQTFFICSTFFTFFNVFLIFICTFITSLLLAVFKGPTFKGEGGEREVERKGREGKEGKGKVRQWKGRGEEGEEAKGMK